MDTTHVSPREISLFSDDRTCLETVTALRLAHGVTCPRCRSRDVSTGSRSPPGGRLYQQYRCVDCGYGFGALAGTFLMGAKLPLMRYIQVFTLHNALGESLGESETGLATGIRSHSVAAGILRRIRLVDPGIAFTRIHHSPPAAPAPQAGAVASDGTSDGASDGASNGGTARETSAAEGFFRYCEARFIRVDRIAMRHALDLAVNTPLPELVAAYQKRGRPRWENARARQDRARQDAAPMPAGDILIAARPAIIVTGASAAAMPGGPGLHDLRKSLAKQWLARFAESVPDSSTKQRIALAWQLAALGVDSDLAPASVRKPVLIELRSKYLQSRALL